MRWTDEQTALLRKLWEDGLSGGQIAKKMGGGLSRNAVIGKAFRIGCPHRFASNQSDAERQRIVRTRSRAKAARKRAVVFVPNDVIKPVKKPLLHGERAEIAALPPIDPNLTIETVVTGQCCYMRDDPKAGGALCGRATTGGSWCVQHRKLVYTPEEGRTRKLRALERMIVFADKRGPNMNMAGFGGGL